MLDRRTSAPPPPPPPVTSSQRKPLGSHTSGRLQFATKQEGAWTRALKMSLDAGLAHKQARGIVSLEYDTTRLSKYSAQEEE